MENKLLKERKKSFSFFEAALACLLFIILNTLFLQSFYKVPASTISGNIVVPSVVTKNEVNYTVTEIADKAYYASSKVNNIIIPNTIEKIGNSAFAGTGISSIYIPSSVKYISAPSATESPFFAVRTTMVIYLESDSVPETFDPLWNYRNTDQPLQVKYGYSFQEYLTDAKLTEESIVSTNDNQVGFVYNSENKTAVAVKGKEGFSRSNNTVYYVASFLLSAVFGLTAFIVAKCRKVDFFEANGMKKKVNWKIVGLCALISLVSIYGFSGFTNFFCELLAFIGYKSSSANIEIPNFGVYLVYVLVSCMAPGFFEETLFRGTIQSGLNQFGKRISIVVSALVFMLMHGTPDQTIHQFIIGYLIGYIFFSSGNLWLGVLIHFFNNFIAVSQMFFMQGLVDSSSESAAVQIAPNDLIVTLVYAVITGIAGFYVVKYLIKKVLDENNKLNGIKETNIQEPEISVVDSTVLVNGEPQDVFVTVSGESTPQNSLEDENKNEFEKDEFFAETQQENESKEESKEVKKPETSIASILMFSISVCWLVIQWLITLIGGF